MMAMTTGSKRINRIQQNPQESLLEERLKIANVILPEDNLEDLVQLPIAPELVSRRLRAKRGRESNNSTPLLSSNHQLNHLHSHHHQNFQQHPRSLSSEQHQHHQQQILFLNHQNHESDTIINRLKPPTPDSLLSSSDEDHPGHPHTPLGLSSSNHPHQSSSAPQNQQISSLALLNHSQSALPQKIYPTPSPDPLLQSPTPLGLSKPSGIPQRSKIPFGSRPSLSNETELQASPQPSVRTRKRSEATENLGQQRRNLTHYTTQPKSPSAPHQTSRQRTTSATQPRTNNNLATRSSTNKKTRAANSNRKASDPSQSRSKSARQRPRSVSVSSIENPLPPWSADPSPQIYRIDPLSKDSAPKFDDLILPAVARQLEKQQNLLILDSSQPSTTKAAVDFSEWEKPGAPVLMRGVSNDKPSDGSSKAQTSPLPVVETIPSPLIPREDDLSTDEESEDQSEEDQNVITPSNSARNEIERNSHSKKSEAHNSQMMNSRSAGSEHRAEIMTTQNSKILGANSQRRAAGNDQNANYVNENSNGVNQRSVNSRNHGVRNSHDPRSKSGTRNSIGGLDDEDSHGKGCCRCTIM
ncbi:expressed protein [Phakopsora pachyrhizi]|uniref:Expressed protein n=1 Tax=Phakopsora pachyrhizi TaxID=170000 RepID=A0AAV0B169_PHAPC|nr:expressed protein [Phakopsora pachyrhizi]